MDFKVGPHYRYSKWTNTAATGGITTLLKVHCSHLQGLHYGYSGRVYIESIRSGHQQQQQEDYYCIPWTITVFQVHIRRIKGIHYRYSKWVYIRGISSGQTQQGQEDFQCIPSTK